jgi:hypothetical protein
MLTTGRGELLHRIIAIGLHADHRSSKSFSERDGVPHRPDGVFGAIVPDEHGARLGDCGTGRNSDHRTRGVRRQAACDAADHHVPEADARCGAYNQQHGAPLGRSVVERRDNETVEHRGLDVLARKGLGDALEDPAHPGSHQPVAVAAHLLGYDRVSKSPLKRQGRLPARVEDVDHLQ